MVRCNVKQNMENVGTVERLIRNQNLNVENRRGVKPLCLAVEKDNERITSLLIQNGANVNYPKGLLKTAVEHGNERMVELLLQNQVNVNSVDSLGETALHFASYKGYEKIVEKLLKKGANVNLEDVSGKTALHQAASFGREKVAELLLQNGANINQKDTQGKTALHFAAEHGHTKVVDLLREKGADINVVDNRGKTAAESTATLTTKKVLRNEIKKIISTMTAEDRLKQSASITSQILSMAIFMRSKRVSVYLSTESEVSTKEILNAMFAQGKEVFVPTYAGSTMKMVKINDIADYESLPLTKWNIKQPRASDSRENANLTGGLDLVLLPGVAFTKNGGRMGHGMGYYDKYLQGLFEACPSRVAPSEWRSNLDKKLKEGKTALIGLAFKQQMVDEVPIDVTDILLDVVVTSE
ncbi:5-formyltetrahydrofolate cyclo-ligase [Pseudolycoriella hygida]|uniref:5-formyltetrahydrofolate cyclo-ligase n=1 Tax=Pseudolycoriella hygida TaxID=35572 RepID=A0A9Q0N0U5_9DIPT|nr:5-formyltetrahydrofolate cyclo-ligase [Pseudolycoriella hygida]